MQYLQHLLLVGAGTTLAQDARLFVTSYAGTLSTLSLKSPDAGQYKLMNTSVSRRCNPSPSWISVDIVSSSLICVGEGMTSKNGTLTTFNINNDNGTVAPISSIDTLGGPVFGSYYGDGKTVRNVVLAHYGTPGAISSFKIGNDSKLAPLQNITFPAVVPPGAIADRQAASHTHQTVVDPTGKYILVPDLGADLVRVFTFDPATGILRPSGSPLKAKAGTGPRHVVFHKQDNKTFLYVVGELGATLTGYTVTYGEAKTGLKFAQIYASETLGGARAKGKNAPAELRISPDSRFLTVSNRNDSTFSLVNPDPNNKTAITSDSLATFAIQRNGSLDFVQLWPAGGRFPRSFDFNKEGDKVAVGLQMDGRVVVCKRDVRTGLIGKVVASYGNNGTGMISSVKWYEAAPEGVLADMDVQVGKSIKSGAGSEGGKNCTYKH